MTVSLYANLVSTISSEWTGFPGGPNHRNIDEIPGAPSGVPFTISYKNYNIDKRDTLDVYEVSFTLPVNATDIKMYVGARMRTTHHFGRFYAHVSIYNGVDHWYTLSEILDPYQWEAVASEVIEHWTHAQVVAISQLKIKADTNPIDIAALYLYIQYELGYPVIYGTGKIYGTGLSYGLNPI